MSRICSFAWQIKTLFLKSLPLGSYTFNYFAKLYNVLISRYIDWLAKLLYGVLVKLDKAVGDDITGYEVPEEIALLVIPK